jgi:hypothetical protein
MTMTSLGLTWLQGAGILPRDIPFAPLTSSMRAQLKDDLGVSDSQLEHFVAVEVSEAQHLRVVKHLRRCGAVKAK